MLFYLWAVVVDRTEKARLLSPRPTSTSRAPGLGCTHHVQFRPIVKSIEVAVPTPDGAGGVKVEYLVQEQVIGYNPVAESEEPEEPEEPFGDSPLGFSLAMLEQVCEKYPVDRDRIVA